MLGIDTASELAKSPFAGSLFEGFVASEIVKAQVNGGGRREIYHFRDEQGLEVDFVVPRRGGSLALVECKDTRTVRPAMAAPMLRLRAALEQHRQGTKVTMSLVHQAPKVASGTEAVAPGVRAQTWRHFVEEL